MERFVPPERINREHPVEVTRLLVAEVVPSLGFLVTYNRQFAMKVLNSLISYTTFIGILGHGECLAR